MNYSHVDVSVRHVNPVIGAGLVSLLSRDGELRVADRVPPDDAEAPSIVIADYRTGLALLKAHGSPDGMTQRARVIVFTARGGGPQVRFAIEQGASGYVLLDADVSELLTAVRRVADGRRYLCAAASQSMAESLVQVALTQRELEVLRLVARGMPNKLIARSLSLALGTVKAHVKAGLEKLGAKCRTEAVAIARDRGLLDVVDDDAGQVRR